LRLGELTTDRDSFKQVSFHYHAQIDNSGNKHTLSVPHLLGPTMGSSKLLFPRGIFSKINDGDVDTLQIKRIELFAKKGEDKYGIIRSLFVGFSSEKSILRIAEATSGVVQVTAVRSAGDSKKSSSAVQQKSDTLIVKRSLTSPKDANQQQNSLRLKIPSITVPNRWKDRMNLSEGDCLVISNPIADFQVPPPNF